MGNGKIRMKIIKYHKPVIEMENLYDVEAGGITVFARCFCNPPENWGGLLESLAKKEHKVS